MSTVTNSYETVMVFSAVNGEEGAVALFEKFKGLIESNGTLTGVDEWGKRRLAYLINDETEAYYYLVRFESGPEFISELDRIYKITDGVLRSIIIRKDQ